MEEKTSQRNWKRSVTLGVTVVVALGVAYIIGAFVVGPGSVKAGGGVIPTAVLDMPTGILTGADGDGNTITLLVRIAETTEARTAGLRNVGVSMVLLYAHAKAQTTRVSYDTSGIRAPLELAVIDESGSVVTVKKASKTSMSVSVSEKHQWVLAAKQGLLAKLGIAQGSVVKPGDMRRIA